MLNWNDIIKFVNKGNPVPTRRVEKTDEEWKELLSPIRILLPGGRVLSEHIVRICAAYLNRVNMNVSVVEHLCLMQLKNLTALLAGLLSLSP